MASPTLQQKVIAGLREAARHNAGYQEPPAVILWPDPERQWETVLHLLQPALPELLVLGDYDPAARTGPAIWLRCMVAQTLPEETYWPAEAVPVLYLPGVSRYDLRAPEPEGLTLPPLREYQYSGMVWLQENGREWTIAAFLQNPGRGLGRKTAHDPDTKAALLHALPSLFNDGGALYGDGTVDAALVLSTVFPDAADCVLRWLETGEAYLAALPTGRRELFEMLCRTRYGFRPEASQRLLAAEQLGQHTPGGWATAWQHFTHAPHKFRGLPDLLRQAQPPGLGGMLSPNPESWPQVNEGQEAALRQGLLAASKLLPTDVVAALATLEAAHALRREWVWAELGESPLACALPDLQKLAEVALAPVPAADLATLRRYYETRGYQADTAFRHALAATKTAPDRAAVQAVAVLLYQPWLEAVTSKFQGLLQANAAAFRPAGPARPLGLAEGQDFVLFVDAFRFDVAKEFTEQLVSQGYTVTVETEWSALPSVTPTAKCWVSPLAEEVSPESALNSFEPQLKSGKPLNAANFRAALPAVGFQSLPTGATGPAGGRYWQEIGEIDKRGHEAKGNLVHYIPELLRQVREAVDRALAAGARQVRIVTDHGWLLLPGGLPKELMPKDLVETRWGRFATLKPGATSTLTQLPWTWNPGLLVVYAPGISFFKANEEYAHGGLSLHECLVPVLTIAGNGGPAAAGQITAHKWVNLRCQVEAEAPAGSRVDLRTVPGDATTSMVFGGAKALQDGRAALMADDSFEGKPAVLMLLSIDGTILDKVPALVGG